MAAPFPEARSYLVAVDGSDAAYHALGIACDLARRVGASVRVLYVTEVPRSAALGPDRPGDVEHAEGILAGAARVASDHGVRVEVDRVQARQAGHAVVDAAIDRRVDAIVLGVAYHRPLGQFTLGRLSAYVLEHAPTEVWLIRYPAPELRR